MVYTWEIDKVDFAVEKNGLENVAINIHFKYVADNENGNSDFIGGVCKLNAPNENSFTSYSDLTKEDFIQWLVDSIDPSAMQYELNKRVAEKATPTIMTISYSNISE